MSSKLLASNHFDNQRRNGRTGKGGGWTRLKLLRRRWTEYRRRRLVRKDRRLRKRASYLAELPQTPWRRLLHKLHPKELLLFVFSLRGLILGFKVAVIGALLCLAGAASLYLYYRQEVPSSIASLQSCISGQSTKYYDRTGKILLWSSKSDFDCQPVRLEEVSPHLIDALLTIEDREFYDHRGVKLRSIARAAINNLLRDEGTQGGSTITQQYVKNAILQDRRRTFDRKIKEVILAIEIERAFEKDDILTAYLNTVAFGSIYGGVEAASQGYLNKSASELTLDEAALLVAALPAPSNYWSNPERHVARQKWVLSQMLANGVIDQASYDEAVRVDTLAKTQISHEQYENIRAPHFILEAEKRLTEELCALEEEVAEGEESCDNIRLRGYKVITTLDFEAQKLAEQAVASVLPMLDERGFDNAAMVAVDVETGKVLAEVGSRDFRYPDFGQTNTATQQRDPGSSFKIFDYGGLIENSTDWGPGSILYDYETTFDNRDWTPSNYTPGHAGPITMRRALGQSINIPAVKAMYIAGVETVHDFAYQAGIRTELPCAGGCGLASAFGAGAESRLDELANAYASFGRGGVYVPLTYIERVVDAEDKVLRQWRRQEDRVFRAETAYLLNHMLSDRSVRFTRAYNLDDSLQTTMAMKTGTDDSFVNNHIVGYTKAVAAAGWIGYHDEAATFEERRDTTPPKSVLLKTFMEGYHRNLPFEKRSNWARPPGIKQVEIDLLTGYQAAGENSPASSRGRVDIFPSWYTPQISPDGGQPTLVDIDSVSGQIATICTPEGAVRRVDAVQINNEIAADDEFYDAWMVPILTGLAEAGRTVFSDGGDSLHSCDDRPPRIRLVDQPTSCSRVCRLEIAAEAGTFDLTQINVIHNGQILSDGSLDVEGNSARISYDYRPLSLDSPPSIRGLLLVEVVDEALYADSLEVRLQIDGFPAPGQLAAEAIQLISARLAPDRRRLRIEWRGSGERPQLVFSGACGHQRPLSIQPTGSFIEIDVRLWPTGPCQVLIRYDQDEESNRLDFEVLPEAE